MTSIKFENVCKYYKDNKVIENFTYEFKSGVYLLTGENGSGKSTILKLIKGYTKKTSGKIKCLKKVSFTPEKVELNKLIKVSDMFKVIYNYKKEEIINLLKIFNIEDYYDNTIKSLSKGTLQKVIILLTAYTNSDVYLFDEPLNGLDVLSINTFVEFLLKLKEKNKIIIIATHSAETYNKLGAQSLFIKEGKVYA